MPLRPLSPWPGLLLFAVCLVALSVTALLPLPTQAAPPQKPSRRPLLMAHYMPWFAAKPFSVQWGWHWTMGHFDPDHVTDGRRDAASHSFPLIGLYDSGDPDVLLCHALLMKMAGIDGVIFDWYGNDDHFDYAAVNRNTERMIPILQRVGLRFAICYETQTVPNEITGQLFPASDAVAHGQRLMQWMDGHFFNSPAYLKIETRPVFLAFGNPYYNDAQWNQIFSVLPVKPLFFTESARQEATASSGGFDWPAPADGTGGGVKSQDSFYSRARDWPYAIAAAYPGFDDIYQEAGVGKSWGRIDSRDGDTYRESLSRALRSDAVIVQLVTWNDWGEGTQIEPSLETGYRDLETTQRLSRRSGGPVSRYTTQDLRFPVEWYRLCKSPAVAKIGRAKLDALIPLALAGKMDQARGLLAHYAGPTPPRHSPPNHG